VYERKDKVGEGKKFPGAKIQNIVFQVFIKNKTDFLNIDTTTILHY